MKQIVRKRQSVTISVSLDLKTAIWLEDFQFSRNYSRSQAMRIVCDLAQAHLQEMNARTAHDAKVSAQKPGHLDLDAVLSKKVDRETAQKIIDSYQKQKRKRRKHLNT